MLDGIILTAKYLITKPYFQVDVMCTFSFEQRCYKHSPSISVIKGYMGYLLLMAFSITCINKAGPRNISAEKNKNCQSKIKLKI